MAARSESPRRHASRFSSESSIRHRQLGALNHEHRDRAAHRFEPEPNLVLHCGLQRRAKRQQCDLYPDLIQINTIRGEMNFIGHLTESRVNSSGNRESTQHIHDPSLPTERRQCVTAPILVSIERETQMHERPMVFLPCRPSRRAATTLQSDVRRRRARVLRFSRPSQPDLMPGSRSDHRTVSRSLAVVLFPNAPGC